MTKPQIPNTPIDDKLFTNIFRFVALCATADEYFFFVAEGLITLELKILREQEEAKGTPTPRINKMVERRYKELLRIDDNRKRFFKSFVEKFNKPPYSELVDTYVEQLTKSLNTITVEQNASEETK
jgi:hypothetical protein